MRYFSLILTTARCLPAAERAKSTKLTKSRQRQARNRCRENVKLVRSFFLVLSARSAQCHLSGQHVLSLYGNTPGAARQGRRAAP